jgi:hypothetical protein
MNIEDKRYKKDTVCFSIIKNGTAFEINNDTYMKVDIDNAACNAINLSDGTGSYFMSDNRVFLVYAKVIIQNDI